MTLPEFQTRLEGYLIRVSELEQLGIRRFMTAFINKPVPFMKQRGFVSERAVWPMSIDAYFPKKDIPKSEDMFEKHKAKILEIWPDAKPWGVDG